MHKHKKIFLHKPYHENRRWKIQLWLKTMNSIFCWSKKYLFEYSLIYFWSSDPNSQTKLLLWRLYSVNPTYRNMPINKTEVHACLCYSNSFYTVFLDKLPTKRTSFLLLFVHETYHFVCVVKQECHTGGPRAKPGPSMLYFVAGVFQVLLLY